MKAYIENILTDREVRSDIKTLIPDAGLRRRMSRLIRTGLSTALECIGGADRITELDAIITATGLGCLTDSEKFLRNMIINREELLSPTPFIQSTFNTVGGQIALLKHHHCCNTTYVNGDHSFEDALLDALMQFADREAEQILVGAFDERTDTQYEIMKRMGAYRKQECSEGCVFTLLTREKTPGSLAGISGMDFFLGSSAECPDIHEGIPMLLNDRSKYGVFPVSSSFAFAEAVGRIREGEKKVMILNQYPEGKNVLITLECTD